jgi:uncharacterized protein (TIRG00374 family)
LIKAEESSSSQTLPRRIIAGAVFGAVVYAALTFAADVGELRIALSEIPWYIIVSVLGLASMNYLLRFEKWHYFVTHLGFRVPRGGSLLVFLSGLVMSVTPGKMGEVLKSYLLKRLHGAPISTTAPAVLVERLTDLVALMLLAAVGGYALTGAAAALGIGVGLVGLVVAVLSSEHLCTVLTSGISRFRRLELGVAKLDQSLKAARSLVKPRPLILSILISIPAWFCECIGFWLIVKALGYGGLGLMRLTGIYALAAVVGAVSMLPGGLGATELTLAGMLRGSGMARSEAVAATLVVRAATLWYAVVVGAVFLGTLRHSMDRTRVVQLREGSPP